VIYARPKSTSAAEADAICKGNQLKSNFREALRKSQLAVERSDEVGVQVAGKNEILPTVRGERGKEPVPEQRVPTWSVAVVGHAETHADHARGVRDAQEVGVSADKVKFRLWNWPDRVGLSGGDQDPIIPGPSILRNAHRSGAPRLEYLSE